MIYDTLSIQHFDRQYRGQMPGNLAPVVALIPAGENRPAVGPEVKPDRIVLIPGHGLAQYSKEAAVLRQSGAQVVPGLTGIP